MNNKFIYTDLPNYHFERNREITKKYPGVKKLLGNNPHTAFFIIGIVLTQYLFSFLFKDLGWPLLILFSYMIGAFLNHALYVHIHECAHNLVFKSSLLNKVMGIICDLPIAFPGALSFREYHLVHHKRMNEDPEDPDAPSQFEANLIGNSTLRKMIWLSLFGVFQALRPFKLKKKFFGLWILLNVLVIVLSNILIFYFIGPKALIYLFLSTIFGLGLHPCGGRWIQEHYIFRPGQETYSYYGPLNKLAFNVGYHNEHHDFANISWEKLPQLKKMAPEYYDSLKYHTSWLKVLREFIFSPKMGPFSRIIRKRA